MPNHEEDIDSPEILIELMFYTAYTPYVNRSGKRPFFSFVLKELLWPGSENTYPKEYLSEEKTNQCLEAAIKISRGISATPAQVSEYIKDCLDYSKETIEKLNQALEDLSKNHAAEAKAIRNNAQTIIDLENNIKDHTIKFLDKHPEYTIIDTRKRPRSGS